MRWSVAGLLLLAINLGACVSPQERASARFAREFDCSESSVKAKWVDSTAEGDIYRVRGCGRTVNYICMQGGGCKREGGSDSEMD